LSEILIRGGSFQALYLLSPNQQNSQLSTGPKSESGKQKAALNSTRHGFTGQVVMLTAEEAEPYRLFNEEFMIDLEPVGAMEQQLARSVIDAHWRINQIHATESAIYALGHRQYLEQFADETPETAAAMARAMTFENKRKDLDRLHRYESRLQRQAAKDFALLRELQETRTQFEERSKDRAVRIFLKKGKDWNPDDFGFVWSIEEIEQMARVRAWLPRQAA
jgi:hypothetical protein